jgi:hypothetical protein
VIDSRTDLVYSLCMRNDNELRAFRALVGKVIGDVRFEDTNASEGTYTLVFTDGTSANFSSSGDDATRTSFWLEEGN